MGALWEYRRFESFVQMDMAILSSMECVWVLLVRVAEFHNFKSAFGNAWRAS